MLRKKDERHNQKQENLLCQNQRHRAYHKFWMIQIRLKQINVYPKMGLRYQTH